MYDHIGIGGINAIHYFQGEYFVNIRLPSGANVVLRLPEDSLEDAPTEYRRGFMCLRFLGYTVPRGDENSKRKYWKALLRSKGTGTSHMD